MPDHELTSFWTRPGWKVTASDGVVCVDCLKPLAVGEPVLERWPLDENGMERRSFHCEFCAPQYTQP